MEKVLPFIANHWILVTAFVVALIWLIVLESRSKGLGGARLSPQEATRLINHEQAVVVDIRDSAAFNEGHIVNSLNIPAAEIDQHMNRLEAFKQRPVIVVCMSGQKSFSVVNTLKKQGFEKVSTLAGGISAWKNANMPVVK